MLQPLPGIDDHVATPETREEYIDGRIVHVAPATYEHAVTHTRLNYLLWPHAAPGYISVTQLLTRTSHKWDFAADSAILKAGTDSATGTRNLEELAFQLKSTRSMSELTRRAEQLIGRGVRRVFTIFVSPGEQPDQIIVGPVFEWSRDEQGWLELPEDGVIDDVCLCRPLAVRALMSEHEADEAVVRALLAKEGYVRGRAAGYEQGRAESWRQLICDLCEIFDIEMTPERRIQLHRMGTDELEALRAALKSRRQWP